MYAPAPFASAQPVVIPPEIHTPIVITETKPIDPIDPPDFEEIEEIKPIPVEKPKPVAKPAPVAIGDHNALMAAAGIAPGDYGYVEYIVSRESGWRHTVYNGAGSGAYGLCQALPGSKMASAGSDWATNPVTQLKWCNGYAIGRYGSWAAAVAFWQANHWW